MFKKLYLLVLVLFSVTAFAQKVDDPPTLGGLTGSVSDGAVTYEYTAFGGTDAAGTNLTGASGGDDLFESWWFFRVSGDGNETPFPDPDTATYVGDTVTLSWSDVAGRGFSAELVETVSDGGGPSGNVFSTMTITDLGGGTTVDIFVFADIDLGGSFGGDSATVSGTDFISLTDAGDTGEYRAGGANATQALAFPGLDPILSDGALDNLDNSGFPFGPGDFTGAFQWTGLTLAPEQGVTLQAAIAINEAAPVPAAPEFTTFLPDPPQVPTLSTWGLIGMALLLLVVGSLLIRRVQN